MSELVKPSQALARPILTARFGLGYRRLQKSAVTVKRPEEERGSHAIGINGTRHLSKARILSTVKPPDTTNSDVAELFVVERISHVQTSWGFTPVGLKWPISGMRNGPPCSPMYRA